MVKPDAMAPDAKPRLVRWVSRARRAAIVVVGAVLITAIVKFVALAELVKKVTDYLEFTQSPALRLAENTAKSEFSDRLTRMAWRRLYLARLFSQRVIDEAPLGEIDSAWSTYINASADWNAELMILIVGLERYYGAAKSDYFEGTIQIAFAALDDALRALRRSDAMRKLRSAQALEEAERQSARELFDAFLARHSELNAVLYNFARCFEKGNRWRNVCESTEAGASAVPR
jgi:hypothetical protein